MVETITSVAVIIITVTDILWTSPHRTIASNDTIITAFKKKTL